MAATVSVCVDTHVTVTSLPNGAAQIFIGQEAEWEERWTEVDSRHAGRT